jgi:hypothetical protein
MCYDTIQPPRRYVVVLLIFLTYLLAFSGAWAKPISLAPIIAVSASSLTGFTTQQGTASQVKSYTFTVKDLPIPAGDPDFTVTVSGSFELGLSQNGSFSASIPLNLNSEGDLTKVIFVRIKASATQGNISGTINHALNVSPPVSTPVVLLSGTVSAPPPPTLTVNPASLSNFLSDGISPSQEKHYQITGSGLTNSNGSALNLSIAAPPGFELQVDGTQAFGDSQGISGNGTAQINVRLKAGLAPGTYSGNITHTSSGLTTVNLPVSGVVETSSLTVNPTSLSGFTSVQGTPSTAQSFIVSTKGFSTQSLSIAAPEGFEIAGELAPTSFGNGLFIPISNLPITLPTGKVFVRLKAFSPVGAVTGSVVSSVNQTTFSTNLNVSGQVTGTPSPIVTFNLTSLQPFTATQGTPSSTQSYFISALGFSVQSPDDNTKKVTVNAPANFEIGFTANGPFASSKELFLNNEGLLSALLHVRIKASAPAGTLTGNITHSNSQITTINLPITGTVVGVPTTSVNPNNLSGFVTAVGTPSTAKSFTISGTSLPVSNPAIIGVSASAPAGFELALAANGPFSNQVQTLAGVDQNGNGSRELFVRLKGTSAGSLTGNVQAQMGSVSPSSVSVSGVVTAAPTPSITFDRAHLSGFTTETNKPSADKVYDITHTGFPTNSILTIKAPTGYEIKQFDENVFVDVLALNVENDGANSMSVRLKATATPGTFAGNITHESPLITTVNLPVSGVVSEPTNDTPSISASPTILSGFTSTQGTPSAVKSYIFSAANFQTFPSFFSFKAIAPAGYELSLQQNGPFTETITTFSDDNGGLQQTVFVRLKANAPVGTVNGKLIHQAIRSGILFGFTVDVELSGTVNQAAQPTTTLNPTSLSGFSTDLGTPSAAQSFTLSGSNLAITSSPAIGVLVTAPAGYQVSQFALGPFSDQLQTVTGITAQGTASQELFVRLKGTAAGPVSSVVLAQLGSLTPVNLPVSGTVAGPVVTFNPASLPVLTTSLGVPSAPQSYVISASNFLTQPVKPFQVSAPFGFEVSDQASGPFNSSLNLTLGDNGSLQQTVFVRVAASAGLGPFSSVLVHRREGESPSFNLTVECNVSGPTVTFNPTTLPVLTTVQGTPSAPQAYVISASNFPTQPAKPFEAIAPSGFELSEQEGGPFSSNLKLTFGANGSLQQTVFVRVAASAGLGLFSSVLVHRRENESPSFNLAIKSNTSAPGVPAITLNPTSLSGFATQQGTPSAAQSYVVTVANAPTGQQFRLVVNGEFEVATEAGGPFQEIIDLTPNGGALTQTVFVRLKGNTPASNVSGQVANVLIPANNPNVFLNLSGTVRATPPAGGGTFQLIAPDYNCASGAFTFKTSGGNGSIIEYFAIGITGWTTNPNQFVDKETRTAADAKPLTLFARQNGVQVNFVFDIRAQCPVGPGTTPNPGPGNQAPVFHGPLANLTAQQNTPFSFIIPNGTFTDPENQALTLSASGLPNGLSLIGSTLSGTPTQTGNFGVTIKATDPAGTFAQGTFTLTVNAAPGNPDPNPNPPTGGGTFQLIAPDYNCASGAFTFKTSGGNGSLIEYFAPGITGWTTNPNQFVDKDLRTAADAPPLTLFAHQNGVQVSFVFDIRAQCPVGPGTTPNPGSGNQAPVFHGPLANQTAQQNSLFSFVIPAGTFTDPENQALNLSASGLPNGLSLSGSTLSGTPTQSGSFGITITATDPNGASAQGAFTLTVNAAPGNPDPNPNPPTGGGTFQLIAPDYNCTSGAFMFKTSGGNGSVIEYMAPGISSWTTNPNQFVDVALRTAADAQPLTLFARQSGVQVTFIFDIRAQCPVGARLAAPVANEPRVKLQAVVYPNPVSDEFTVAIEGAQDQTVRLLLTNLSGHIITEKSIDVRTARHEERLQLTGQSGGMYLLLVATKGQFVTLKVVKQ